jgi:hypothetical protein
MLRTTHYLPALVAVTVSSFGQSTLSEQEDESPSVEPAQRRWVVLFSGNDPAVWNTYGNDSTYAIPLDRAPSRVRYLRLRRLDTNEAIIVSTDRASLGRAITSGVNPYVKARWNGVNDVSFGGRHLGIAEGRKIVPADSGRGKVAVQMEGFEYFIGSGFGHIAYGDGVSQHYAWHGQPIKNSRFEIAVTGADLTDYERFNELRPDLVVENEPPTRKSETSFAAAEPTVEDPRWFVLFRGRDPAAWNTTSEGATFARPLAQAPPRTTYLRLTRLDTGEAQIVPISASELGISDEESTPEARWNGLATLEAGARHLGIRFGPIVRPGLNANDRAVIIQTRGFDGYAGSGFGHLHHGDGVMQHFGWRGTQIDPTAFEIAVTEGRLTPGERALLVGNH